MIIFTLPRTDCKLHTPLRDSNEDRANVSVMDAASANLSHSLENVTYVGVMYCTNQFGPSPGSVNSFTHIARTEVAVLDLVLVLVSLLFWLAARRVHLFADETEGAAEASRRI